MEKSQASAENRKIGQFIAQLREQKKMTQGNLAQALKTSQSAVARMEKGEQNLSTGMLSKISTILGHDVVTLGSNTVNFEIEGGHKLSGEITVKTSKNAAVSLLMASLLNTNTTTLKNMPRIEEVNRIIEVLTSIGVSVTWHENGDTVIKPPKKLKLDHINKTAAEKTRSVIMMMGPLAHLFKNFSIPQPGGCKLGARTVRPHLYALEKLGIQIETHSEAYHITSKKLSGAEIVLYESGDTVTENVLMAAAKIPQTTVIKFASSNYMVQDLCFFLQKLGVKISGIGSSTLTVHGVKDINKPVTYAPSEDPIEAMMFLSIAATTHSAITIKRCPIEFLELELLKLEKMGFKYTASKPYAAANGHTKLVDIKTQISQLKALEEKIYARPFPGVNIDNLPFFVPVATQAEGQTLIHDWVYENRAIYYMELTKLRANIILADPHRVFVRGITELRAAEIICPPALRPAAIILIAMLAARGTSLLRNVYSINRGYEDLCARLQKLGAKIKIVSSM
ncbi:MAG: UDP-N-acetylglucosamine 1-carboxyvinyltransferase [Candidatus Kerfeldbacteria bacterium RIFCSPHIGHO2_12_FULL_48_17]|uniref:UDP-N-acetylglucosamine 1-carboxyvinyltransferase n=1 Tax=Candidatus Kerfeldbacteria bacterium RIFCSPHIGHO2_12_FULL_48_17 TaxID=1798542 RepID=A0A1G2B655_9BACT|nr:MAG: UDP-N-acetylglucosamine 1-carboxyvinyltransferase [Candidatus Kerfeldbacteria bacterium RIFCSPHIGHO2_12_FULL_48_17]